MSERRHVRATRLSTAIHVVDDEPDVLKSVLRLLYAEGFDARGFLSPEEFLAHCESEVPACAVVDLEMPTMTGLELQKRLCAESQAPAIVFLTGHGDIPSSVQAMRAGAVDFLTKPLDARDLLRAVREAVKRSERQRATCGASALLRQRLSDLTARERQVLHHIVQGRLNKQIAGDLGISERTVRSHRARVMRKMGARTLAQLVHMADQATLERSPDMAEEPV